MISLAAAATGTGFFDMFSHSFMRNAFLGGTMIAAASGLVGYFVVLRSQVFSVDALSHVAFTGALAALAFGIDARLGLFAATIAVGAGFGILGRHGRADDVVIGTVFTWVLGLGVLFLSIYTTTASTGNGTANVNILFGSIFGLSVAQAITAALVGAFVILAIVFLARPLLFATVDESVALARGVPVRALGIVFLALVGLCAGEATQAVGALLLLGLIAAPAAAAQRLTTKPFQAFWLAGTLAVGAMWVGLTVSYLAASIPPSFAILATATALYVAAAAVSTVRAHQGQGLTVRQSKYESDRRYPAGN